MIGSWFKSGEQVSPSSPSLALIALLQEERQGQDWEQVCGKFVAACSYIFVGRGEIFSSYYAAEKCIKEFVSTYLPHWQLSSPAAQVWNAYVWAIARTVALPGERVSTATQLLDKLVTNGAQVAALRDKISPTGLRKLLGIGASKVGQMQAAVDAKTSFDMVDSMEFLNDQFMHLRQASYLSWHSNVDPILRVKFPGVVAYKNMRMKL